MNNVAVILGAGNSTRMKSEKSKLLLSLDGKTVLRRSVEAFLNTNNIQSIIVVCREQDIPAFRAELPDGIQLVIGGATRQESVMRAVEAVTEAALLVIHDGARPLVRPADIEKAMQVATQYGAAALGVPVKDTIKIINESNTVVATPDRATLFAVQTPQVFRFEDYCRAMRKAQSDGKDFTDDCQLIEYAGGTVKMVEGDYANIKITTPEDIAVAESLLKRG